MQWGHVGLSIHNSARRSNIKTPIPQDNLHLTHVQRLSFNSHTETLSIQSTGVKLFVWHVEISQVCALCSTITEASPRPAAGIRAEEVLWGERYCLPSLSDDADISMGRKTDVTRFWTTWCMCQKAIIQLSCHPAPLRMEAWGERDKSSRSASILRRLEDACQKTRKVDSGAFGKELRVQI